MGLQEQEQHSLLSDYDTKSAYSVAYNTLFANIRFALNEDQGLQHTILLAAPTQEHTPGLVATNLAIAAAQNGIPALLVDADLSAPCLHRRLGLGLSKGLSDLLVAGGVSAEGFDNYVQPTFLPDLLLISGGEHTLAPPQASNLLMTQLAEMVQSMKTYLAKHYTHLSLLILHSPPILNGIEASIIAAQAEQTYLLITRQRTSQAQAKRALKQLERTGTRIAGTILLDV